MPAVIPIVAAVAAAGVTSAVQANQTKQARKDANRISEEQKAQSKSAQAELDARAKTEETNAMRDQSRDRTRRMAAGAGGRSSTILTSPLGVTAPQQTAAKTLLGT